MDMASQPRKRGPYWGDPQTEETKAKMKAAWAERRKMIEVGRAAMAAWAAIEKGAGAGQRRQADDLGAAGAG
jgi:hypothetical protein